MGRLQDSSTGGVEALIASGSTRKGVRALGWMDHLACRLVFPLALIVTCRSRFVVGPCQIGHFHDNLRPHPMHARQLDGRADPAVTRGRLGEGHFRYLQRRQHPARRFSSFSFIPVPARPT